MTQATFPKPVCATCGHAIRWVRGSKHRTGDWVHVDLMARSYDHPAVKK